MEKELILKIRNMSKYFGVTKALRNVDLEFYRGEIRGLVGENGSGKSTVSSIIAGMQKPTEGRMLFKDEEWNPATMVEAQKKGISMVLQETNTIPDCSVAENIFAGRLPEFSKFGILNKAKLIEAARSVLSYHGIIHISPEDNINSYSFEDRKLIEIVRCVDEDTELLVIDETTTALSHEGREWLYTLMRRLKEENRTVVFISHDMDEILAQCTDLTVLRDGQIIGTLDQTELNSAGIVDKARFMMVGRDIGEKYYRDDFDPTHDGDVALEFDDVTIDSITNFSLKVHKGEIVGIGGLSGSGMRDIGRAAYGLIKPQQGRILRHGKPVQTALNAVNQGIGYISKNRDTEALILEGSIKENIILPLLPKISKASFVSPGKEKQISQREIDTYRIKCFSRNQTVDTLSGGNKQKVSFAKWTAMDSDVIIMDCPTRGVDIGVKKEMYDLMVEMKKKKKAIIMISEELTELIGMSDRLLIMKNNRIAKEFMRSPDLKETDVIGYMI